MVSLISIVGIVLVFAAAVWAMMGDEDDDG